VAVQSSHFNFKQEQIHEQRDAVAVWRYESGDVAGRQFDGD
jgi:hypothetical protein